MTRIFLPLSILSLLAMGATLALGLRIGNAAAPDQAGPVSVHLLSGMATIVFSLLVHALVLTYFLGTGRWLEETCNAYRLEPTYLAENRTLKWRIYPLMTVCLLLLIATGAFGAAADPASAVGFRGWGSLSAAHIHLLISVTTLALNMGAYGWEYLALRRNGELVTEVLSHVRRIRTDRGLPVD
jgi:hypothetical protein